MRLGGRQLAPVGDLWNQVGRRGKGHGSKLSICTDVESLPVVFWALALDQAGDINGSDSGIVLWNSQSGSKQIQAKTDLVQS